MPKIITTLSLDQTRFILRLKDVNCKTSWDEANRDTRNYLAVREHLHSCTQDWKPGAKHWTPKKSAMTKSAYPLDGGSVLTMAVGWSEQAEYHFITVQFNPPKLTGMAAMELKAIFECMFDWGYAEFFHRADCSYIEIPLDVRGAKMTDYLFFDTRLKSVDETYEADGTLYLGSNTGRWVTVYDKAKEIADKGGPVLNYNWLRIEPHLKPNIPATEIADLPCAFDTLRVIDRQKLAAIKHNISVMVFRNRVFEDGMQAQAAFLMATNKKGLLAGLQAATPNWYEPTAIWEGFPAAAHRVSPAGLQLIAQSPHPVPITQPAPEGVEEAVCT